MKMDRLSVDKYLHLFKTALRKKLPYGREYDVEVASSVDEITILVVRRDAVRCVSTEILTFNFSTVKKLRDLYIQFCFCSYDLNALKNLVDSNDVASYDTIQTP